MKNKRGQSVQALPTSIISLVVAIILLVMGVVIINEIRDTDTVAKANSASFTNETIENANPRTLSCNAYTSPICSITRIANRTAVVPTNNYTVNTTLASNGCVVSEEGGAQSNDAWNITYGCTYGDAAFSSANSSLIAVGDFSDFIPIIVIALAAAVVIGLILAGFAFRQGQR